MHPDSMNYATSGPNGPAEKRANGLGIASLILGILAFLGGLIPFCGLVPTILFAVIGGILGLVGLIAALSDKRTGVAFPIAGVATCILAVVFGLIVTMVFATAATESATKMQKELEQQQKLNQNSG